MSLPLERSDPAEGAVDWKSAERRMLSPTAAEADEAGEDGAKPEATEPREFKYRGKTIKADAETYEVLEGLRREARGENGRLGSELARMKERLARAEGVLAARTPAPEAREEIKPPDPMLATRDITAYQRDLLAYHDAKLERAKQELEDRYMGRVRAIDERVQEEQKNKEWADRFYASYDHLDHRDIKPVVVQVYTEHKEEIDALSDDIESAQSRLAELVDARLVRLSKVGKETDTEPTNRRRVPRIESTAGATPRAKTEAAPREFSAASWVASKREAFAGRAPKKE